MRERPTPQTGRRTDSDVRRSVMTGLLVAALVLGIVAVGIGLLMAGVDLSTPGEEWDGFGVFIGLGIGLPGLAIALLSWFSLRIRDRRPGLARGLEIALSVALVAPILLAPGAPVLLVPLMIGCGIFGTAVIGAREDG
ncbi:MAG: hypothetical protein ACTHKG_16535 [Nocardioides sp.]